MNLISNIFNLKYPKLKGRIDLYDFLRGLAMFLVLAQHAVAPGWKYLLVFHMPLFFFLSGLVSANKELPTFDKYIWLRFKRLMIPYFVFGFFDIIVHYCLEIAVNHHGYSVLRGIIGVLTCQIEPWGGIGVYWFLFTIFVADLLLYPLRKCVSGYKSVCCLGGVIVFLSLSYCSTRWFNLSLFSLDRSFMAAAFILIGILCKPLAKSLEIEEFKWLHIVLIVICFMGVYVSKQMNPQSVLMYINQYGSFPWFLLGATSGIGATMLLGKYLFQLFKKRKGFVYELLMWIGFNSLVLFPVHLQIKVYIGSIYTHLGIGQYYWMIVLPTMLIIGVPVCNFITYYLPWILGNFTNIPNRIRLKSIN